MGMRMPGWYDIPSFTDLRAKTSEDEAGMLRSRTTLHSLISNETSTKAIPPSRILLGGFSQPLGAGVAALWFKLAGRTVGAPGEVVYGCMFAITAGVMASVALQLFQESVDLTHSKGICMAFAFLGMGIMGVGSALTA